MRAEKLLNQEDRIKFILNGKTFYYTREELREYFDELYQNSGRPCCGDLAFERILAKLEKYDGDPYGELENLEARKQSHEMLAMGIIPIIS